MLVCGKGNRHEPLPLAVDGGWALADAEGRRLISKCERPEPAGTGAARMIKANDCMTRAQESPRVVMPL